MTPEERARQNIDAALAGCDWAVQSKSSVNLSAQRGVAVAELSFKAGAPDYTLFVDGKALGTVEAKPEGHSLTGVEAQSAKYVGGVPFGLAAWRTPLPFCYESTGSGLGLPTASIPIRAAATCSPSTGPRPCSPGSTGKATAQACANSRLSNRVTSGQPQFTAITRLEQSFAAGRRRALIQMATGSGKTYTAVNFIHRLVKYGGAKRVLFLVDRGNLGEQTLKEFQQFVSPVNNYKFTEEYIVQHLTSNTLDKSARVVIGTIQRLSPCSRARNNPARSGRPRRLIPAESDLFKQPVPVEYNPTSH